RENLLRGVITFDHQLAHFLVDLYGGGFAVVPVLSNLASQEDLFFLLAEGQRTEFTHPPLADHLTCKCCGPLDIVARTCAHLFEEQLLSQTTPHQDGNPRL